MIQANELRRGNLVLFNPMEKIKRICEVMEIKKDRVLVLDMGLDLVLALDEMSPVPLTPDILERCGFENKNGEYYHPDNTDIDLMITCSDNGLWCAYNFGSTPAGQPFPETTLGVVALPICNPFKFVHQLQNLYYALTQTELTINL